ncbi:hypothetical protein SAMN04487891_10966 [Flagellimonas taeanensis]|uniref:Uncharacterized protein n=1 Tax=Flagellimonas taeanensis TaxID=1005926 RepID=A0A1M7AIS6_9FLAO|nr:hypothetical protein [Allomuricauda taeanensis]SFC34000.1 hypothetical protein SAMN04487891_10966 [Allomuricauda taeanensis]SHL42682.1 hypothetical protein SAMN05216293_3435 [Allomuricauda taeanensis]
MEAKHYIIASIIVLVALAAGILSAWQYLDGKKSEKESDKLQQELSAVQKEVLQKTEEVVTAQEKSLQKNDELIRAQSENNKLSMELIETQNQLNQLQGETLKQVIGDGWLRINVEWNNENEFELMVESMSQYPIYETSIFVYEQADVDKCPMDKVNGENVISKSCFDKCAREFGGLLTMNPMKKRPLGKDYRKKLLEEDTEIEMFFTIHNKHNTIVQYSIISKDGYKHFYRIFEVEEGAYKQIASDNYNIPNSRFEQAFYHFGKELRLTSKDIN